MKRILIVAPFTLLPDEIGDNRFRYIAELLATRHHVTLVTSNFNHPQKKFRQQKPEYDNLTYRLLLLAESGYTKNISIARMRSHNIFAKNLRGFLANQAGLFDYVYAAFPPIDAAGIAAEFARQQNIPFILDVQDVWPEALYFYFKRFKGIAKGLLNPLARKADAVYAKADVLIATNKMHFQRVESANKKASKKRVLYIGCNLPAFDVAVAERKPVALPSAELVGIYIGTLSHSYDIATVVKASAALHTEGLNLHIVVLGEGPFKAALQNFAKQLDAPVTFLGLKQYAEMCAYLNACQFGLHSIVNGSQSSLTNKFSDYCAAGLPILNSNANPEIWQLIETKKMGLNYEAENVQSLKEAILQLAKNVEERKKFGQNARLFAEQELDRTKTYPALFDLFED